MVMINRRLTSGNQFCWNNVYRCPADAKELQISSVHYSMRLLECVVEWDCFGLLGLVDGVLIPNLNSKLERNGIF